MDLTAVPAPSTRLPLQRLGTACLASGVLGLIIGALSLAYPAAVPKEQWSYPFPTGVALAVGVLLALTHVLTLCGYRGVLVIDPYEGRRPATVGLRVAMTGLAGLALAEIASGLIGGDSTNSTRADVVGGLFGVATLLTAVGSIVAGVAVARAGRWTGPARWALLVSGLILVLLVTPANVSDEKYAVYPSLMLWSLTFVPLGLAVANSADPRR